MSKSARFALAASTIVAMLAISPAETQAAEPQRFPFAWDSALWSTPRPSPFPVNFDRPKDFHRQFVQLPDGSLGLQFVDVLLPSGFHPLMIKRSYRSSLREIGVFGIGWSSNLDVRLMFAQDGTPRVVESNGSVTGYQPTYAITGFRRFKDRAEPIYDTGGPIIQYDAIGGAVSNASVERSGDGWRRHLGFDGLEFFDRLGRLIERRANYADDWLKFSYADSTSRHPIQITDAQGRVTKLTYRGGLLVQADFPPNRTVRYVYEQRFLTEVIDPIGRKTSFTYANGGISRMALPGGTEFAFLYAANGTLREVSGPGSLRTEFEWQTDSTKGAVRMTAKPSFGPVETLEFGAAAVSAKEIDKNYPDSQLLALQIRRTVGGREQGTVSLLPRSVQSTMLVKTPNAAAVLQPQGYSMDLAAPPPEPDDIDAWRMRFTPVMGPRRDSKTTYDGAGRAIALALEDGIRETWKWDDADRIVEWSDADGSITTYEYDNGNRVVRITRDGIAASAEYNEMGLITKAIDARGGEQRFGYDAEGHLVSIRTSDGRLVEHINDREGRPTEVRVNGKVVSRFSYDGQSRLTAISDGDGATTRYSYDQRGNPLEEIDNQGRKTSYRYDSQGRPIVISYPDGSATTIEYLQNGRRVVSKDADGAEKITEYDAAGRILKTQLPGQPEYSFSYDIDGRIRNASDSAGSTLRFAYQADGRLVSERRGDGSIRYDYDREGNLAGYDTGSEKITLNYEDKGNIAISKRKGDQTLELRIDTAGRLIDQRDAAGNSRKYDYDSAGLRRVTGPDGNAVRYDYDRAGQVVAVHADLDGKTATKRYKYDDNGRTTEILHEDGVVERFGYDAAGRLTIRRDRLGNSYSYRYTASGRLAAIAGPFGTEQWRYDDQDRLIERSDPTEGVFRFEYSARQDQISTIDPEGNRTRVTINADGQPLLIEDALGSTTRFRYDRAGRLSAFTDPNGNETAWTYDHRGSLIEQRTPLGKIYRFKYDESGKLAESQLPDQSVQKREYDALGRLSKLSAGDGRTWVYSYDRQSRVSSIVGPLGRELFRYDELDRIIEYRDASGAQVRLQYDSAGRVQSVETVGVSKVSYGYTQAGLLTNITRDADQIHYSYDPEGRIAAVTYPNNTRTSYRYLTGAKIQSIVTTNSQGKIILGEEYQYDSRGNVIAIDRKSEIPSPAEAQANFKRTLGQSRYQYDKLNRIVVASFPDGLRERFTYDRAGNLINHSRQGTDANGRTSENATSYSYDADQALTRIDNINAVPHPAGGSCLPQGSSGCATRYDALNRLVAWRDQEYEYDGSGRLLAWKDKAGNGSRYVYHGSDVSTEIDGAGKLIAGYMLAPAGHWVAMQRGQGSFFPIRSANGSLLALTDKNGAIVESCAYGAYSVRGSWSSVAAQARCEFAGGRQLGPGFWFGSRMFSDVGARFMTRDANGPDKDGNLYSYALGNPLRFVDQQGTSSMSVAKDVLRQAGFATVPELREHLVQEFARDAATHSDPNVRQEAQAIVKAIESKTVPYRLNLQEATTRGGYDPFTGRAQSNLHEFARANKYTPAQLVPELKGNVAHEVLGHGLGKQDIKLWMENPNAPINEIWKRNGTQPVYGVTKPYTPLDEIRAFQVQRKWDPTLGGKDPFGALKTDAEARAFIQDMVMGNPKKGIEPLYPRKVFDDANKQTLEWIGEKEFYSHTIKPAKPFEDKIAKLQQLRLEQAAESTHRVPVSGASEIGTTEGTVSRAVAREISAAERALQEARAIAGRAGRAAESAGQKAISRLAGLYDRAGSLLSRLASKASRAIAYLANTQVGRFAGYVTPALVPVMAVKGAIDMAIWLGQSAGELAADLVIGVKKKLDRILDALDKLANQMATKETPKAKKARLTELLNRASPEPQQLHGSPPGGGVPSAGSTAQPSSGLGPNKPLGGSAVNQPGGATGAQPQQNDPFPRPNRPLGGSAANQPGGGPDARPDRPIDPFPRPDRPLGGSQNQPSPLPQQSAAPPQRRDLSGMCGSDFRQSVQRMTSGQLSGAQATQCWCYFWEKGGSNQFAMLDGRPVGDRCAQSLASVAPPPPPAPPRPAAPPPRVENDPEPKDEVDHCVQMSLPPCPGKSREEALAELDARIKAREEEKIRKEQEEYREYMRKLREQTERIKASMTPEQYQAWLNSPMDTKLPPIEQSHVANPGRITPKPSGTPAPQGSSGGGSGLRGLVGAMLESINRPVTAPVGR